MTVTEIFFLEQKKIEKSITSYSWSERCTGEKKRTRLGDNFEPFYALHHISISISFRISSDIETYLVYITRKYCILNRAKQIWVTRVINGT